MKIIIEAEAKEIVALLREIEARPEEKGSLISVSFPECYANNLVGKECHGAVREFIDGVSKRS